MKDYAYIVHLAICYLQILAQKKTGVVACQNKSSHPHRHTCTHAHTHTFSLHYKINFSTYKLHASTKKTYSTYLSKISKCVVCTMEDTKVSTGTYCFQLRKTYKREDTTEAFFCWKLLYDRGRSCFHNVKKKTLFTSSLRVVPCFSVVFCFMFLC